MLNTSTRRCKIKKHAIPECCDDAHEMKSLIMNESTNSLLRKATSSINTNYTNTKNFFSTRVIRGFTHC